MLFERGVNAVAGRLLDPEIWVGPYISRGFHPLMHDWTSQGDTAKNLTLSILVPMFLRLAMSHEELLADKQAAAEAAEDVVKPQEAALVWQLIVGERSEASLWPSLCNVPFAGTSTWMVCTCLWSQASGMKVLM